MSLWLDKLQRTAGIRRSRGTSPSYGNYIVWCLPPRGGVFAIIGRQFLLVVIVDYLLDVTCADVIQFIFTLFRLNIFLRGFLWGKHVSTRVRNFFPMSVCTLRQKTIDLFSPFALYMKNKSIASCLICFLLRNIAAAVHASGMNKTKT